MFIVMIQVTSREEVTSAAFAVSAKCGSTLELECTSVPIYGDFNVDDRWKLGLWL